MDLYNIFGGLSSVTFLLCLGGILDQLNIILKRKRSANYSPGFATSIISINRFLVSFFSFYSFLCYGLVVERFNHFLVWPRLVATSLMLLIMREIFYDRKDRQSKLAYAVCLALLTVPITLAIRQETFHKDSVQLLFSLLILGISILLTQASIFQIRDVIKNKSTGALSLRFQQFTLLKDLSGIAFAIVMGLKDGWPIMLMHTVSAVDKTIMMTLFRKFNKTAE